MHAAERGTNVNSPTMSGLSYYNLDYVYPLPRVLEHCKEFFANCIE